MHAARRDIGYAPIATIRSLPGKTRTITSIALLPIKERGATGWLPEHTTDAADASGNTQNSEEAR